MKPDHRTWTLVLTSILILPAIFGSAVAHPPTVLVDQDHADTNQAPYLTDWSEQAKLVASDGGSGDHFGYSVAIDGDYAIVGSIGDSNYSGAAYVFSRSGDTWIEQAKLIASDRAPNAKLGYSVAISGTSVIVGASGDAENGPNSGAAYVFVRDGNTWIEQAKLIASDGGSGDLFGWRVAISGDTAFIGAIGDDDNGNNAGAVYVFARSEGTWTQQAELTASDGTAGDEFGRRLSIHGDHTVIAARKSGDENGNYSGSAYVFVRNGDTWTEQAKLTAGDGTTSDRFGYSVAIGEDYAVVGAIGDGENGNFAGAVYAFVRDGDTWTQQAKLTAGDGAAWDRFGYSASIHGDTVVVGAIGANGNRANTGSVYVFVRNGNSWTEQAKLVAGDGDDGDEFGQSVSISGATVLIGATGDDDNGELSGSAYVFQSTGESLTPSPSPIPSSTRTPTPGPTRTSTRTPTPTPTATPTTTAHLNYLPLIAHQWRAVPGSSALRGTNSPGR